MSDFLYSVAIGAATFLAGLSIVVSLLGVVLGWLWVFWLVGEVKYGSVTTLIRFSLSSFIGICATLAFLAFLGTATRIILASLGYPI